MSGSGRPASTASPPMRKPRRRRPAAIKTGAIRDFLDNSVVAYETAAPGAELKTSDIADAARAYTLLIACTATEPVASAKR